MSLKNNIYSLRHPVSQDLHTKILGFLSTGIASDIAEIKEFIDKNINNIDDWGADVSHGHSELHTIIDLLFNNNGSNKKLKFIENLPLEIKIERFESLFEIFSENIIPKLSQKNKIKLLNKINTETGFNVLTNSLISGQKQIIAKVLKIIEKSLPKKEVDIKRLLIDDCNTGLTPLMAAVKIGDLDLVREIDSLLHNNLMPESYKEQWQGGTYKTVIGVLNDNATPELKDFVIKKSKEVADIDKPDTGLQRPKPAKRAPHTSIARSSFVSILELPQKLQQGR